MPHGKRPSSLPAAPQPSGPANARPGRCRGCASGLRNAKADNTRRAYGRSWAAFTSWAQAHGYQSMPASPQHVALYLGRLAADGKVLATINQARAAISHFHAAAGMQKADNPARHPVVAGAGLSTDCQCPGPGPRDPTPAQARPRWPDGIRGDRATARRPGPGHH